MKLGEAMYKAQQAGGGSARGRRPATQAKKDDVVDADFKEVDDDKKKNGVTVPHGALTRPSPRARGSSPLGGVRGYSVERRAPLAGSTGPGRLNGALRAENSRAGRAARMSKRDYYEVLDVDRTARRPNSRPPSASSR